MAINEALTIEHTEWPVLPPAANIVFGVTADGVHIGLQPLGVFAPRLRMWMGLIVIWSVFSGIITYGIAPYALRRGAIDWIAILTLLSIWGPLVSAIIYIRRLAKHQAIVDVVRQTLIITYHGALGVKQREWQSSQIRTITCERIGGIHNTNRHPLMVLKIDPLQGKAIELFLGRDVEELQWLAEVLRVSLRLSHAPQ